VFLDLPALINVYSNLHRTLPHTSLRTLIEKHVVFIFVDVDVNDVEDDVIDR